MDKIVKDLANKAIEKECMEVTENISAYFKGDSMEQQNNEYLEELDSIMKKLSKVLPEEYHGLVDEFENVNNLLLGITERRYFKQGVIAGLTNLKYLEEVGEGIQFI